MYSFVAFNRDEGEGIEDSHLAQHEGHTYMTGLAIYHYAMGDSLVVWLACLQAGAWWCVPAPSNSNNIVLF